MMACVIMNIDFDFESIILDKKTSKRTTNIMKSYKSLIKGELRNKIIEKLIDES